MKTLLLLIPLLLISGLTQAQTINGFDSTFVKMTPIESLSSSKASTDTKSASGAWTGKNVFVIGGYIDAIVNLAPYSGGYDTTISAGGDSVSPPVTSWWSYSITADDTICYSEHRGYPATDKNILLPGQIWNSKLKPPTTKLYYKIYGTGNPILTIKMEGN